MKREKRKGNPCWRIVLAVVIAASFIGSFLVGIIAIQGIRSNVRSTTVQVIQEITNSKSQMLAAILEEAEKDLRSLAASLETLDRQTAASLLERFDKDYTLTGLTIIDRQGNTIYGSADAYLLKGIPADFARQTAADGFAMSNTLISVDGDRIVLFGMVLFNGQILYASLPTDSMQKACGETTYLGEGYSYILGRNGKIVIPPVRYSYEQVYENIRNVLAHTDNSDEKIERFIEALDAGATGSVVFCVDGKEQLFCFEPVQEERHWQLVTVVSLDAVEKDGAQIIRTAMVMASIIIAVVIAALAAGSLFYWSMQRKQKENDRFLLNIYQAISENTDTVIFILNNKAAAPDYVFENSGRILGVSAEEFLKKEAQQERASAFRDKLQALLWEPWPAEGCQREMHTYNDRLHRDMWLKVLICPFLLGGEPKCLYAVTDVTQEHQDREKIAAAVVAAEQANAAKSSFFSSVSHDMRTPMNGIVGMTAIAKRSLDDRARVLDCLNKIDLSSRHLLGLINDVLDMSKIESGKLALVSEPFDLSELLQGLEALLRPQCESKEQTLTFTVDVRHTKLVGDTLRLNQIFMNLLSNAVKFTPEGGTVSFTAQEQEQRAGSVTFRFTVADNGIGIPLETQKHIFTPFERAPGEVVRQIEGTGLGLAIAKNLISAMSGQITLKSAPGQGAAFMVDLDLPMQEGEAQEAAAPEAVSLDENSFAGRRLLLAEDNELNREIAVELLSAYGAKVDTAHDGKQALEQFAASAPGCYDAILMDIQMPVMNGYEAAREIRACGHPQAKRILIVAMTANVFAEDVLAAKNAGMDAHVAKPIDLARLYQVLNEKMAPLA
ncbi:hybrid sensor histidine kinase/response regulator [Anaeromassilibacillus senegalensis]|uniref:hybrid sensor histidine kinase/response regulator n=1 Tax=Anaeromassilibacillus senegalensis TaxID=1673717 RepID=UPI0006825356|nr:ATP-binding protein [Anaeromassilibacillus senegalensis]